MEGQPSGMPAMLANKTCAVHTLLVALSKPRFLIFFQIMATKTQPNLQVADVFQKQCWNKWGHWHSLAIYRLPFAMSFFFWWSETYRNRTGFVETSLQHQTAWYDDVDFIMVKESCWARSTRHWWVWAWLLRWSFIFWALHVFHCISEK